MMPRRIVKKSFSHGTVTMTSAQHTRTVTSACAAATGAEAHARGLPLLGAIQIAILPKQGVLAAPAARLKAPLGALLAGSVG